MFAPSKDEITINTDPEGADVYEGVNLLGKTPLTHTFDRETSGQKVLSIKKQGHKSHKLELVKTLDEKSLLNFVFFLTTMGATSWGIDAISGNMIKYSPNSYLIELEKEGHSINQIDNTRRQRLHFVVLNYADLIKDIAKGNGEYLKAYYEIRPSEQISDNYQEFLNRISNQVQFLLVLNDPVDLYIELEKSFGSIQVFQNRQIKG
jgi:hypothetical protein